MITLTMLFAIRRLLTLGSRQRGISVTVPRIAIVVPFTEGDLLKVVAAVERWPKHGNPCPSARALNVSPLHALFWFNRDLGRPPWVSFATHAEQSIHQAIQPIEACFSSITFGSAQLSDAEDPYPRGASNMWYKLYMSPNDPLGKYDYFLWAEQDLVPVRSGWMDALIHEVAFHRDFFMRGSIHRGSLLDDAVNNPHEIPWATHINGNAIYTCHDEVFRAMVRSCYVSNSTEGARASFDLAIWMKFVTDIKRTWKSYQMYAHKFQYTDFMQAYGYDLPSDVLMRVMEQSPATYMIHGDTNSAGEQFKRKAKKTLDVN